MDCADSDGQDKEDGQWVRTSAPWWLPRGNVRLRVRTLAKIFAGFQHAARRVIASIRDGNRCWSSASDNMR